MRQSTIRTLALACAAAVAFGGAASAQDDALAKAQQKNDKRFDRIEHQLHQLQSIITQARDTGQPITVRVTSDPDPVLSNIQNRLDDMEQSARTRNDQIDSLTHDLQLARKDAADAKAQLKAMAARLDKMDARLKTLETAAAAAPPAAPAGDQGLGASSEPPPPPQADGGAPAAAPAQSPEAAFKSAKQLLLDGDYARASSAFQAFVTDYGDSPNGPEARYWLGETLFIRGMYADAATAYIGAIRGWPQTPWAPDAVVKLARSLVALKKPDDACRTLTEFDRRYPAASTPVKARAESTRTAAHCGA